MQVAGDPLARGDLLELRLGRAALRFGHGTAWAQVHHRDAIGDALDDPEIVGDEQVGETELPLQNRSRAR